MLALLCAMGASAQTEGGIDADMLARLKAAQSRTATDRALQNAAAGTNLNTLAANKLRQEGDAYFSNRVNSRGITDQQSSGRCWLFTGLNVLRAKAQARHGLGEFTFSHNYIFFFDQLDDNTIGQRFDSHGTMSSLIVKQCFETKFLAVIYLEC